MNSQQQKLHDELARKLTDEGKLIEIGWETMRLEMARRVRQMERAAA